MKITIDCNEEQAQMLVDGLETMFRPMMNQWSDFAEMLAQDTFTYDKSNPNNDRLFDEYITRRDNIETLLQAVGKITYGEYYQTQCSDNCRCISDFWSALRHELYMANKTDSIDNTYDCDVRARTPFSMGSMELPKISVEVSKDETD